MNHPVQCQCGTVRGFVEQPRARGRALCYCRDCQAFTHFLGKAEQILDAQGGTDVVPVSVAQLHFTAGLDQIACMRLSPTGLLRWYARCCNTPIGNTPPNTRIPYIGLVHSCLGKQTPSLTESFGPITMRAFTKRAKGTVHAPLAPTAVGVLRVAGMVMKSALLRHHRYNPLLREDAKTPIVQPHVISEQERQQLMAQVQKFTSDS